MTPTTPPTDPGGLIAEDEEPFDLVLVKVDPASLPLYFVVRWPKHEPQYRTPEHVASVIDDHTCPTNWTDGIIAVIANGDHDPHGFAKFVAIREPPEGMDRSGDIDDDCNTWWPDIFPEAFVAELEALATAPRGE